MEKREITFLGKRLNLIFAFTLIFSLLLPFIWDNQPQITVSFFLYYLILLGASVFLLLSIPNHRGTTGLSLIDLIILILISIWLLSSVFSTFPKGSIFGNVFRYEGFFINLSLICFFYLGSSLKDKEVKETKKLLLFITIFISALTIMQKIPYGLNDISVLLIGRSSGVFTSPIVLGLFFCMVFPLAIYDVFYSETAGKKLLGATYSLFIFISVFYTESKTALIIILLITAYMVVEYVINTKNNRTLIIIIFFTLLILMGIVFKGTVQKMFDNAGMSIRGRFMIWEISLRSINKKPLLGEGLNMYPVSYLKHQDKEIMSRFQKSGPVIVYHPHNLFLDISTESGLTSFLFYLFLLGSIMFPLMKKKGNKTKSEIMPFMLSVFGYLLALMVSWSISMVNVIFWLILGILYKKAKDIEAFNIYPIKPNKYLKYISYTVAIALMIFSIIRGISYVSSEIKHYKIQQYVVSNPIQAMSMESKDLQFKSFESYHWYYISLAYAMTWNNSLERLSRDEKINGFQITEYTAKQGVILNPYNIEALLLYLDILNIKQKMFGLDLKEQINKEEERVKGINPILLEL